MSKSINSPTSRLLQSSRLFSLPRPLPQPALDTTTSTGVFRASESATLPYPTHQTIATPASSQSRGDWGLKRPLPSKATRNTSTPHIRVRQQDNAAHITDFGSAADHSLTLRKWEQMGVPLMPKKEKDTYAAGETLNVSVYDEPLDHTDPNQLNRWKHAGPWLPGMKEGEFELWVASAVAKRKDEFREFLKQRMVRRRVQEEQQVLRDAGEARAVSELRRVQLRKEVEENFGTEEKRMRDEHTKDNLSSEMSAAICEFLDLPGLRGKAPPRDAARSQGWYDVIDRFTKTSLGPPSTHPAAGLSHIRSQAYLENHPLWGPQLHRAPVLSRVLRYRNNYSGQEITAKLGVGGVVTSDPISSSFKLADSGFPEPISELYKNANRMVNAVEPDLPGGNKMWVHVQEGHIDEEGRISMRVSRGDREAIAVKEGNVEQIHEARRGERHDALPSTTFGGSPGFNLPHPATRPAAAPRSFTEGFDGVLNRQSAQSASGSKDDNLLANLRQLARAPGGSPPRR